VKHAKLLTCKRIATPLMLLALWAVLPGSALYAQKFPVLRWQKFLGTPGRDVPHALLYAKADSALYLAGATDDAYGATDAYLIKTNLDGTKLWERKYGGDFYEEFRDICPGPNNTVFVAGGTGSDLSHPEPAQAFFRSDYYIGKIKADGSPEYLRAYGGSGQDQGYGVAPTPSGGCIVVGSAHSTDHDCLGNLQPLNNAFCFMMDKYGTLWRNFSFGGKKNDWAYSVAATNDGAYVLAGFTNSEDLDGSSARYNGDVWICKFRDDGTEVWRKVIKEPFEDVVARVVQTRFGFIAVAGSAFSEQYGKQFWLLVLSSDGTVLIDRKFGGRGLDHLTSIDQCNDGGFILSGYSYYTHLETKYIKGRKDFWLLRTDPDGNIVWMDTFGGPEDEMCVDVVEAAPGIYFALGQKVNTFTKSSTNNQEDFWLLRIDELPCKDVNPMFTSDITGDRVSVNEPVRFFNQTPAADGFLWDFGDGTTSTERSPTKIYKEPGVYLVKLTALMNENCKPQYLYPKPVIVVQK